MTAQANTTSIRARLKNRAEELGLDFQTAIQYYAIERFLYRLSLSQWSDRFVVKGAMMLRVWDGAIARPTQDVDMLGRVPNSPDEIRAIIAECLAIDFEDGIVFSGFIEATAITLEGRYPGGSTFPRCSTCPHHESLRINQRRPSPRRSKRPSPGERRTAD